MINSVRNGPVFQDMKKQTSQQLIPRYSKQSSAISRELSLKYTVSVCGKGLWELYGVDSRYMMLITDQDRQTILQ